MGLFSSKKKKEEKVNPLADMVKTIASEPKKTKSAKAKTVSVVDVKDVLLRPRITEKAANMTSSSVYTFDVRVEATKKDVADAVKKLYKVTPIKVNIVNIPRKKVAMRRKRGFGKTAAGRKAYVFLKKGEEITFA